MLFNSPEYALFLPAALLLFYATPRRRYRQVLLLIVSYLFYAAWDWRFLGLIFISTGVDFLVSQSMERSTAVAVRQRLLAVSLVVNLGILAAFKYFGFFVESAAGLLGGFGLAVEPAILTVALPVGISFYTFQTMSYSIDVYRRRIPAERDPILFALYVAFFPQLVAGPIERAERLLPQLREMRGASRHQRLSGVQLILLGLFKKVAIADGVAPIVDQVFSAPAEMSRTALLLGAIGFAVQIYGDFSGYTDIARGTARLLGIDLIENFRQPYLSLSITEFWKRWHISLSLWLRDYLYISMGGNRTTVSKTYRNLMVTMLLGGLWHGASWSFVLWGGLHGAYLVIERFLAGRSTAVPRTNVSWRVLTIGLVTLTWIPFRAGSLATTIEYVRSLVFGGGAALPVPSNLAILAFGVVATTLIDLRSVQDAADVDNPVARWRPSARGLAYGVGAVAAVVFSAGSSASFIYFQF